MVVGNGLDEKSAHVALNFFGEKTSFFASVERRERQGLRDNDWWTWILKDTKLNDQSLIKKTDPITQYLGLRDKEQYKEQYNDEGVYKETQTKRKAKRRF